MDFHVIRALFPSLKPVWEYMSANYEILHERFLIIFRPTMRQVEQEPNLKIALLQQFENFYNSTIIYFTYSIKYLVILWKN